MKTFSGNITKMISKHTDPISYEIPIDDNLIPISDFLDRIITINFNGTINCVICGNKTKKSFFQGHCYPCFINSPQTSECILKPELCEAHNGISRDIEWSEKHCLTDHFVYLALTSGAKVGVTRSAQIPTRWIDQGATQAIKFAKTSNRYEAGAIEVFLKRFVSDRTAWQRMLKNEIDTSIDLIKLKDTLIDKLDKKYHKFFLKNEKIITIEYPHLYYPEKIKSLDLLKVEMIESRLIAIKGQYLLFEDNTVFNVRKHSGFDISINLS